MTDEIPHSPTGRLFVDLPGPLRICVVCNEVYKGYEKCPVHIYEDTIDLEDPKGVRVLLGLERQRWGRLAQGFFYPFLILLAGVLFLGAGLAKYLPVHQLLAAMLGLLVAVVTFKLGSRLAANLLFKPRFERWGVPWERPALIESGWWRKL